MRMKYFLEGTVCKKGTMTWI